MTNIRRCPWSEKTELYIQYHDQEWGVPIHDEMKMFEYLTLETFQAGLSWYTILAKRENFRAAFRDFQPNIIARFSEQDILDLLGNEGIVRHRGKIEAAINNAKIVQDMLESGNSLVDYFWKFTDHKVVQNRWNSIAEVPAKTDLSDKISKSLKKDGFKFVGSTTVYSHLQAIGMVNDHIMSCFRHKELMDKGI